MTSNRTRILAFALLAGLASGCTDQNPVLLILQNQAPDDGCKYMADPGDFLASGLLDVSGGVGYTFAPVLRNDSSVDDTFMARNEVQLQGADIEITSVLTERSVALVEALAAANSTVRSQRFSGRVAPASTSTVVFPIIDAGQAKILAGALPGGQESQIIAKVKVFGTINGGHIESGPYEYPVTLCEGCLPPYIDPMVMDAMPSRCYEFQY